MAKPGSRTSEPRPHRRRPVARAGGRRRSLAIVDPGPLRARFRSASSTSGAQRVSLALARLPGPARARGGHLRARARRAGRALALGSLLRRLGVSLLMLEAIVFAVDLYVSREPPRADRRSVLRARERGGRVRLPAPRARGLAVRLPRGRAAAARAERGRAALPGRLVHRGQRPRLRVQLPRGGERELRARVGRVARGDERGRRRLRPARGGEAAAAAGRRRLPRRRDRAQRVPRERRDRRSARHRPARDRGHERARCRTIRSCARSTR